MFLLSAVALFWLFVVSCARELDPTPTPKITRLLARITPAQILSESHRYGPAQARR